MLTAMCVAAGLARVVHVLFFCMRVCGGPNRRSGNALE